MTDFVPTESGTTIRMPSTANLMIDSADRNSSVYPKPWDFQISKNSSILNGYFTRVATTEVVLEWCVPNISSYQGNNQLLFDISGTGANTFNNVYNMILADGFYTVADVVNEIVIRLNNTTPTTGVTANARVIPTGVAVDISNAYVIMNPTPLSSALGITEIDVNNEQDTILFFGDCIDLRAYRYIDFVSANLTYTQDLKDSSTSQIVRDVLCRWYFAEDAIENRDQYGYPIFMGYEPFTRRRIFNPPKQIRWDSNLPIGNLAFQVYDDEQNLITTSSTTNWLMTLQVSEV